jgi:spore coat protein U-like protein
MNRKISIAIACIAALLTAAPAAASTNGTLGATSQGSIQISVSVQNRAQITGLSDVTFGSVDPANEATSAQSVCVWSNTRTHAYSITASGSGVGNAFSLSNPEGTATATYAVAWADQAGATGGTALTPGTPLAGQVRGALTLVVAPQ